MAITRPAAIRAALIVWTCAVAAFSAQAQGRFAVSADGQQVTDSTSGLVWRRCAEGMKWNGSICAGKPLKYTFAGGRRRQGMARPVQGRAAPPGRRQGQKEAEDRCEGVSEHALPVVLGHASRQRRQPQRLADQLRERQAFRQHRPGEVPAASGAHRSLIAPHRAPRVGRSAPRRQALVRAPLAPAPAASPGGFAADAPGPCAGHSRSSPRPPRN